MTDADTSGLNFDRRLDVRGLACPLPVLKARKALTRIAPGRRLLVEATDPMAAIDIPNFCRADGHTLIASARDGDVLLFLVERGSPVG